jgi:hypothetical protein
MFHESACGGPQGVGSEAYLNGTSQGPTPEDARKDFNIRGRSKLFMKYPGLLIGSQKSLGLHGNLVEIESGQVLLPEKQLAS